MDAKNTVDLMDVIDLLDRLLKVELYPGEKIRRAAAKAAKKAEGREKIERLSTRFEDAIELREAIREDLDLADEDELPELRREFNAVTAKLSALRGEIYATADTYRLR